MTHKNCTPSSKIREYDNLAYFVHEFNMVVAEECTIHMTLNDLTWYSVWEKWIEKRLCKSLYINGIVSIIYSSLKYNEHTVKPVIDLIVSEIIPVNEYIKINHASNTSVLWDLVIEVDIFRSIKKRSQKGNNSRKYRKTPYRNNLPSPSDTSTISFNNISIPNHMKTY